MDPRGNGLQVVSVCNYAQQQLCIRQSSKSGSWKVERSGRAKLVSMAVSNLRQSSKRSSWKVERVEDHARKHGLTQGASYSGGDKVDPLPTVVGRES